MRALAGATAGVDTGPPSMVRVPGFIMETLDGGVQKRPATIMMISAGRNPGRAAPTPVDALTPVGRGLDNRGTMAGSDKRKQSLYFPEEMLKEIQDEANRQDRSLSWIVQQAWRIARNEITRCPSVNDVIGEENRDHREED